MAGVDGLGVVRGDCPSPEVLREFCVGALPRREQDSVCLHVDGCPSCEATLGTVDDGDDDLIRLLRGTSALESVPEEVFLRVIRACDPAAEASTVGEASTTLEAAAGADGPDDEVRPG